MTVLNTPESVDPPVVETAIVKGVSNALATKAKTIIDSGYAAGADPDLIKTTMFTEGVPFSQLQKLFKHFAVAGGWIVDPAVVKAGITAALVGQTFSEKTIWNDIAVLVKDITSTVAGATEKRITQIIKTVMNEADLEFPKKPKSDGRPKSKINMAMVDFFALDHEGELEDFKACLAEVTTESSLKRCVAMYPILSAIACGKNSSEM